MRPIGSADIGNDIGRSQNRGTKTDHRPQSRIESEEIIGDPGLNGATNDVSARAVGGRPDPSFEGETPQGKPVVRRQGHILASSAIQHQCPLILRAEGTRRIEGA